jgi:beta-lactamase superfamily II metal-dependent hydrolase
MTLDDLKRKLAELREGRRYRLPLVRQTVDPLRGKPRHRLRIVCLDVNHGDSTLLLLPSGRVALCDSGKEAWAHRRVIPFLLHHEIGEVTYYIQTHYHEDHVGARDEIRERFLVKELWDYRTLRTGEERDLEGVRFLVLNSYEDSADENDRSLAFRLELDGFVYTHGADLYAEGQDRILTRFPDKVRSHVYRANHHLHGSFSKEHLLAADPCVVVISAEEAIYQRIAYTRDFQAAVQELRGRGGRLRDVCLTLERGNVVVFANGESDWGHATYAPNIVLSGLYP